MHALPVPWVRLLTSAVRYLLPVLLGAWLACGGGGGGGGPAGPPPPSPPAAPSGLTGSATSVSAVQLAWSDNAANEQGFKLERATTASGPFVLVITTGANQVSTADGGLATATTYYYKVRAYNADGNSDYSNTAAVATLSIGPPAAPSNLTATVQSSTSIALAWMDNASNETGFKVERGNAAGGPFTQIALVGPNTTGYASGGLSAGITYHYRVRATNVGGDSAYSNSASATTLATGPPGAPSNLTAAATSSSTIALAWTDNANNETGFKIERAAAAGGPFSQIVTTAAGTATFGDAGLAASTAYYYRVRATNGSGDSAYSNTASATTQAAPPPAAPSNLVAVATSSSAIGLTWNDNASNETGFKVERATAAGGPFVQVGTPAANATAFSDGSLQPATVYYYRVRAANGSGDSAYSNTASAATQALTTPAAPSNLQATAQSSSSIALTWLDNASNETGFKIERGLTTSGFAQIATAGPNVTTYTSTGLAPGTSYVFRVRATNATGDSAYSNVATAQTTGTATYQLTVTRSGLGSGTVTSAPSGINCGSTCTYTFTGGSTVGLTAYANSGSSFLGWAGVDSSSGSTATVVMSGNRTVNATFGIPAGSITLTPPASPNTTGSYTLSWTYSGSLVPSSWLVQEDDNPGFTSPASSTSYDTTSPYTQAYSGRADGVYYYRVKEPAPSTGYSNVVSVTVARTTTGVLRIRNYTKYDLVDLRLNGVQKLSYPWVLPINGFADFLYTGSPTVQIYLGAGFYDASGNRDVWFYTSGAATVPIGTTTNFDFPNPTIAQMLSGFSAARNWDGDYWHNGVPGWARFRFTSSGAYTLYDNGNPIDSGTATLVSWPDYATVISFKVKPGGATILLAYPFGQFYYANGPPDWNTILYVAQ